jgi:mRNA interferase YafQ
MMREIRRTTAFKRDYKREKRGPYGKELDQLVAMTVTVLANDDQLPATRRDHSLGGDWSGFRDCHLKPDLVLIYGKPDAGTLDLVRLGSHSELFG